MSMYMSCMSGFISETCLYASLGQICTSLKSCAFFIEGGDGTLFDILFSLVRLLWSQAPSIEDMYVHEHVLHVGSLYLGLDFKKTLFILMSLKLKDICCCVQ